MAERRAYFREWRRKKGLTQKQVADRLSGLEDPALPVTEASISRIERGEQNYSSNLLYALADIYECEAADLIGRDPDKAGLVIDLLARLAPEKLQVAETLITALAEQQQPFTPAPAPGGDRLSPPPGKPRRRRA